MGFDKPERAAFGSGVKPEGCDTVFVGNLPWDVEEDNLRETFASCGDVARIRLATDPNDGSFKGFGHVQFYDGACTDAAVMLAGTEINGRAIRVDFAPPRERTSFGGAGGSPREGGGGRGGRGDGGRGGRGGASPGGRGGRGGRGPPAPAGVMANKGSIGAGGSGKKISFD